MERSLAIDYLYSLPAQKANTVAYNMNWEILHKGFEAYLRLERQLAENSIIAYLRDLERFSSFVRTIDPPITAVNNISQTHCSAFLGNLTQIGISANSQARMLSGVKLFFKYLSTETLISKNPTLLLEAPKLSRKLPDVLTVVEVDAMLATIDQSKPAGVRNKAILETLYACGLRVSELTNLKLSGLYLEVGFLRIIGKGNKERLVPINPSAIKQIVLYKNHVRCKLDIKNGKEDFLFLNRRGSPLSRVMIFNIVKSAAQQASIQKKVSPHTFRHTFATHLYEGGADLRVIQEMLGHESITTTEIYAKVNTQYLRDTLIQYHPRFR